MGRVMGFIYEYYILDIKEIDKEKLKNLSQKKNITESYFEEYRTPSMFSEFLICTKKSFEELLIPI